MDMDLFFEWECGNNDTNLLTKSKQLPTTQKPASKNLSKISRHASSLPPKACYQVLEVQLKQSRFARSEQCHASPQRIIAARGCDQKPDCNNGRICVRLLPISPLVQRKAYDERVQGHGTTLPTTDVSDCKEIFQSLKKGKTLNHSHSFQPEDGHPTPH